jgi:predicted anti-sigma-YlaC factor YlaD
MDCSACREAISARIDGEDAGLEAEAVDGHLAACSACRAWGARATTVTRSARVGVAEPVPDLTAQIMARITPPARASAPGRRAAAAPPTMVARLGLFLVAAAQLCLAVPALLGNDAGASVHVAHEQGSWALALAVGFLVVAARPGRAAAMLPVVGALAAGLAITMAVDIGAGRTVAAAEAPHGLAFLGLGLLWLLTRQVRTTRSARPGPPGRPRLA